MHIAEPGGNCSTIGKYNSFEEFILSSLILNFEKRAACRYLTSFPAAAFCESLILTKVYTVLQHEEINSSLQQPSDSS